MLCSWLFVPHLFSYYYGFNGSLVVDAAVLTVTNNAIIQPGDKLNIRDRFGVNLDNWAYSISNNGPALV